MNELQKFIAHNDLAQLKSDLMGVYYAKEISTIDEIMVQHRSSSEWITVGYIVNDPEKLQNVLAELRLMLVDHGDFAVWSNTHISNCHADDYLERVDAWVQKLVYGSVKEQI